MGGREENKDEEVVKEVVERVQDKSVSQGDFSDPEYCMRYYHCDKDLRVRRCFCSFTWLQPIFAGITSVLCNRNLFCST